MVTVGDRQAARLGTVVSEVVMVVAVLVEDTDG